MTYSDTLTKLCKHSFRDMLSCLQNGDMSTMGKVQIGALSLQLGLRVIFSKSLTL